MSTAVTRISTSDSAAKVEKDIESFWSLYCGPMALLEDDNVEDSMKKIGGFVTEFEGMKFSVWLASCQGTLKRPSHRS